MDFFSQLASGSAQVIVVWCLVGLGVGVIAKYIMPGKDKGGLISTALIGLAGSFVGGFLGNYLGLGTQSFSSGINVISLITAIAGALILLLVFKLLKVII